MPAPQPSLAQAAPRLAMGLLSAPDPPAPPARSRSEASRSLIMMHRSGANQRRSGRCNSAG